MVVQDGDELNWAAADLVSEALAANPRASVVAATGRTPTGLYAELGARRASGLNTSGVIVFQLDEYLGLETSDRRSLLGWMRRSFLTPLGIPEERVVRLPTDGDLGPACSAFDRAIEARGGIDLAILGLGPNGHLGFNEPPSSPDDPTRIVGLSPLTLEGNARYWGDVADVPPKAVTMGLRQLLVRAHDSAARLRASKARDCARGPRGTGRSRGSRLFPTGIGGGDDGGCRPRRVE